VLDKDSLKRGKLHLPQAVSIQLESRIDCFRRKQLEVVPIAGLQEELILTAKLRRRLSDYHQCIVSESYANNIKVYQSGHDGLQCQ
jgi:hypothetical protein